MPQRGLVVNAPLPTGEPVKIGLKRHGELSRKLRTRIFVCAPAVGRRRAGDVLRLLWNPHRDGIVRSPAMASATAVPA